jgi:bacterial leucyl aminopeptidase
MLFTIHCASLLMFGHALEPAIRPEAVGAKLRTLTEFRTRHTLSRENAEAGAWIENQLAMQGYRVERHSFAYRDAKPFNVVATKPGTNQEDAFIVVCAHYDSRMERLGNSVARAPGADDNASGVAAMLEIARALRDVPTKSSIRFIAFSGEEQGLIGSRAYATEAKATNMNIKVIINIDMIGRPIDESKRRIVVEHDPGLRVQENDARSREWADRLFAAIKASGLEPVEGSIYGSDYIPFEAAGYPCVGLFDGADNQPFYHTSDDVLEEVDLDYCSSAASAVLALLREE